METVAEKPTKDFFSLSGIGIVWGRIPLPSKQFFNRQSVVRTKLGRQTEY